MPLEKPLIKRTGLEQIRGFSSNRGIKREIDVDGRITGGVFDKLGLSINELQGKKLLDVGTGGGRTIKEARDLGLDITGIDIVPAISLESEDKYGDRERVETTQAKLKSVAKEYPGSIIGADAAVVLPFRDNAFDIAFSHQGIPYYARNPKELAISLLEMVRVSKERVVITGEEFEDDDPEGITQFGTRETEFEMAYKRFLSFLVNNYGIEYKVIPGSPSFDFNVTGKLSEKLDSDRAIIIVEAERLKR